MQVEVIFGNTMKENPANFATGCLLLIVLKQRRQLRCNEHLPSDLPVFPEPAVQ